MSRFGTCLIFPHDNRCRRWDHAPKEHVEVAMSPDTSSRRFRTHAALIILACTIGSLLAAAAPAAAQPPGVNHRRGQTALAHLGARLPAVAAQHSLAPARLRELFLSDPYLAVDDSDNLLFIDEFVPEQADPAPAATVGTGSGQLDLAKTFLLHSLPGAAKVIYLDFDGHSTSGTSWNSGYGDPIVSAPYDIDGVAGFSSTELTRIQYIWQRVAEDYLPYGVDVTTQDPGVEALRKSGTGDTAWGQRVVISPTNWYNTGAGGVAYIGAFSWNSDTPCFVFTAQLGNGNDKYTAEAASHEAGHTVSLYHDGVTGGSSYYSGHSGWAPIMGVGYYQALVQWSKGEYPSANNTEDDLVKIGGHGFTYRSDDHGDTPAAATPLVVTNTTSVSGSGIIERTADRDAFSFMTGAGAIALNVTSPSPSPNLDIKADLYDSLGVLVASADPASSLNAPITYTAPAPGTYTLVVDGVGKGDLATGYSDYASLGEYSISGTIVNPGVAQPPVAVATAAPASGNAPLAVQFAGSGSYDPDGQSLTYSWNFGDGSGVSTQANPAHLYQQTGTYTAVLTVVDSGGWSDTASVLITAAGPPVAPSNLAATAVSSSQINLSWTDNSNDESGFAIEQAVSGGSWSPIAQAGANVTTYASTGLVAATTYQFRVMAFNGAGDSIYVGPTGATTPSAPAIHVGDLDGSRTVSKKNWTAKVTVAVHDALHAPVSGAVVSGSWSTGGSGSCTTGSTGTCTISRNTISGSVTSTTFTVAGVSKSGSSYAVSANHDADGDSNGTVVTVNK
jgi:PKD repeat protein